MSKYHVYTDQSNPVTPEVAEEVYVKTEQSIEKSAEDTDESVETDEEVIEPFIGTVVNCTKLNVRKEPNKESEIVCKVDSGSELMIDTTKSTDDWYSVCTEAGIEGFCMKEYISVKA